MRSIGITGGVGAGKSEVLAYIKTHYNCLVILADEVAHELEKPGQECYNELTALLGRGILAPDGTIDRQRMAAEIFADRAVLDLFCDVRNVRYKPIHRRLLLHGSLGQCFYHTEDQSGKRERRI